MIKLVFHPTDLKQYSLINRVSKEVILNYLLVNEFFIDIQSPDCDSNIYYDITRCSPYEVIAINQNNAEGTLSTIQRDTIEFNIDTNSIDLSKLQFRIIKQMNEIDLSIIYYDGRCYSWSNNH